MTKLSICIARCGREQHYSFANRSYAKLFGIEPLELIGRHPRDILGEETYAQATPYIETALAGQYPEVNILTLMTADGPRTLQVEFAPDTNGSDEVVGLTMSMIEIDRMMPPGNPVALFGQVLDNSLNEIYIFDSETLCFAHVNRGARRNLGYTIEELRNLSPLDIKPEFTVERFQELIEPLRTGARNKIVFTTMHLRKDQTTYPVEVHLQLMTDTPRAAFVAIILDITERRSLEKQLRLSQFVIDASTDCVYLITADGRFFYVNHAATESMGYTREELLQLSVPDIDPDFSAERWSQTWAALKAEKSLRLESRHRRKDGSIFPIEVQANYHQFEITECVCAIIRDISERKRAEIRTKQGEEKYRKIFETSPNAIMIVNVETCQFEDVNRMAVALYGYSRKEFLQLSERDITDESEESNAFINRIPGRRRIDIPLCYHRKKDGSKLPVAVVGDCFELQGRKLMLVLVTDRTEPLRLLAEKNNALRDLEEQRIIGIRADRLRSLGEMAAGIAHDLNQPLAGARMAMEHILLGMDRGWKPGSERIYDKLTKVIGQIDRMADAVQRIRTFSREAGRTKTRPTRINDVIASTLDMINLQVRFERFSIETQLAPDLPLIQANPYALEDVFLNLLANARDAVHEAQQRGGTPHDSVIRLQTEAISSNGQSMVMITIVDHGIGIEPDALPHIFDSFYTTKEVDKGTGLGLSIAKSTIEQFGGTLTIESTHGTGTTVTIRLAATETGPDSEQVQGDA